MYRPLKKGDKVKTRASKEVPSVSGIIVGVRFSGAGTPWAYEFMEDDGAVSLKVRSELIGEDDE